MFNICRRCLQRTVSRRAIDFIAKNVNTTVITNADGLGVLDLNCQRHRRQYSSNQTFDRPIAQTTIDEEEREKFTKLSQTWWDELGEFQALHALNMLRIPWIRDTLVQRHTGSSSPMLHPLKGIRILDAGSGGGILSEPLARLGAFVVGVDMVEDNIKVAQTHLGDDPTIQNQVKFIQATVEDLVGTEEESFDAVVASEVVEHVADLETFLSSCSKLVKPGGSIFVTTLNKTNLSYGLAVFAAEQLFKLVPPGTHDWNKFVSPDDLQFMLDSNGFMTRLIHGMMYNPLTTRWSWIKDTSINYAIHAVKLENSVDQASEKDSSSSSDSNSESSS